MHTVKLNINDNIYSHVMFLLKSLNPQDIEILKDESISSNVENIDYETWTQSEISSKSFDDDEEDYSKW